MAYSFIRRGHRNQDELLATSFSLKPKRSDSVPRSVLDYLAGRAMITASLVTRAGSELYLQSHEVPAGLTVATRQSQNEFLRRCGLWQALEPAELELVCVGDGGWTVEQIDRALEWCEQLRLLRWVLKIDWLLEPMSRFPKTNFSVSKGLDNLATPLVANETRQTFDLRPVRDLALEYFLGAAAEMRRRGLHSAEPLIETDGGQVDPAMLMQFGEYIVGGKRIIHLNDEELEILARVAHVRRHFSQYLIDQLSAETALAYSASGK